MGRRTRTCYLCGETYKYCSSCSQDRTKPSYMSEFHSESCKNIFDICTRFNMGMMSKSEAKIALEQCDLSNKDSFKSYVQHDIFEIFRLEEEPKKRGKRIEINPIDEAIVEPVAIEPEHEVVIKKENE